MTVTLIFRAEPYSDWRIFIRPSTILALRCSNSVIRYHKSRSSRCICVVALPTKNKHIGRNAKKAGRHQHESVEPMEANRAMSEMKAQNAGDIQ
jgi:hypothetical protein